MNQPIQFNIFNSTPTLYWLQRCVVSPVVVCHVNKTLGPVNNTILVAYGPVCMDAQTPGTIWPSGWTPRLSCACIHVDGGCAGSRACSHNHLPLVVQSRVLESLLLDCRSMGAGVADTGMATHMYVSSRGDVTMCLTGDCRDGSGQGPPSTSAMTFMRNSLRSQVRKHRQCDRLAIVSCST